MLTHSIKRVTAKELYELENQAEQLPRIPDTSLNFIWVIQGAVHMQIAYACFPAPHPFPENACVFSGTTHRGYQKPSGFFE